MFIFVLQTLQNKWNEICMKQLASGEMYGNQVFPEDLEVRDVAIWVGGLEGVETSFWFLIFNFFWT
jgi:hypothetical protein